MESMRAVRGTVQQMAWEHVVVVRTVLRANDRSSTDYPAQKNQVTFGITGPCSALLNQSLPVRTLARAQERLV